MAPVSPTPTLPHATFLYDADRTIARDLQRSHIASIDFITIDVRAYARDAAELLGVDPVQLESMLADHCPGWLSNAILRELNEFHNPDASIILYNCRINDDFGPLIAEEDPKECLAICFGAMMADSAFATKMTRIWIPVQQWSERLLFIEHELNHHQRRRSTTT